MKNPLTCRILILNYNGKELLQKFLPSVVESAKASRHACAVTVLDNCSSDGSREFVRAHFPDVPFVAAKENKVLCSYNEAVREVPEDIVLLLNNDIRTEKDFVDPLLSVFEEHEDAFFVATHGDRPAATERWGILAADIQYPGYGQAIEKPGYSFSAGIAAFHRERFMELGGYDEIYLPGRYEDVDLCYRGWKAGWKGYYQPESRKYHVGGASFDKAFHWKETQAMVFRNSLLFMMKNVTDPALRLKFWLLLPCRLLAAALTGKWFIWSGLAGAIRRLPAMRTSRVAAKKYFVLKDREVLNMVRQAGAPNRAAQKMKRGVQTLDRHPWMQAPFFALGFFTLRLWYPVQYLLLRELLGCDSVLDLGCGRHSMVPIIPPRIRTVGVELFEPHYQEALKKGRHTEYVQADIRAVEFPDKSFDAVVMLDVLEHLTPEEGRRMLEKMQRWARKRVVIFTPNGYLHQDEYDSNPYMEHRSGWTASDMKAAGFRVYGVRGFKSVISHFFHHDDDKPGFLGRLLDLAQIATYHLPGSAFQLFCVKDLPDGRR